MRLRGTKVRWACATVAPWVLAGGLLVSFTAGAGTDGQSGSSVAALLPPGTRLVETAALVPPSTAFTAGAAVLPDLRLGRMVAVRLTGDPSDEPSAGASDPELHADLKRDAGTYPDVERTVKADPRRALRATLSRRGSDLRHALGRTASRLIFSRDQDLLPPTVLMLGPVQGPDLEAAQTFEPWHWDDTTTTREARSIQSPAAAAAGSTGSGRGARYATDGTTPSVARATALSSATPAPADAMPIEIAAVPVVPGFSPRLDRGPADPRRPRFADLITPENFDREQHCLAQAVYFEARSEPEQGQAAVAQVILNRVKSGLYPSSVCGVVFQNRHRYKSCQFTFTCEGKSLRISSPEAWQTASRIAREVMEGKTYLAKVGGSTHYHADYVHPRWSRRLQRMDVIGRHLFYQLRPGQT